LYKNKHRSVLNPYPVCCFCNDFQKYAIIKNLTHEFVSSKSILVSRLKWILKLDPLPLSYTYERSEISKP